VMGIVKTLIVLAIVFLTAARCRSRASQPQTLHCAVVGILYLWRRILPPPSGWWRTCVCRRVYEAYVTLPVVAESGRWRNAARRS